MKWLIPLLLAGLAIFFLPRMCSKLPNSARAVKDKAGEVASMAGDGTKLVADATGLIKNASETVASITDEAECSGSCAETSIHHDQTRGTERYHGHASRACAKNRCVMPLRPLIARALMRRGPTSPGLACSGGHSANPPSMRCSANSTNSCLRNSTHAFDERFNSMRPRSNGRSVSYPLLSVMMNNGWSSSLLLGCLFFLASCDAPPSVSPPQALPQQNKNAPCSQRARRTLSNGSWHFLTASATPIRSNGRSIAPCSTNKTSSVSSSMATSGWKKSRPHADDADGDGARISRSGFNRAGLHALESAAEDRHRASRRSDERMTYVPEQ